MLDLVVSTPWILIYQILPFVYTFGMSFSWCTPLFFLWSLWEDQWMCGVGCGSSGCLIRWFGVLYSGFWILDLSLCFNVSLSFLGLICCDLRLGLTGKISNGCDRQGGCGKAVWRKISVWSLRFYDPCIHHFSSMESLCFVSRFCLNLIMGAYGLSC